MAFLLWSNYTTTWGHPWRTCRPIYFRFRIIANFTTYPLFTSPQILLFSQPSPACLSILKVEWTAHRTVPSGENNRAIVGGEWIFWLIIYVSAAISKLIIVWVQLTKKAHQQNIKAFSLVI